MGEQPGVPLTFKTVTNASSYRIMVSTDQTGLTRDVTVVTCSNCIINDTSTTNSYPATVLNAGTTYYWEIHGRNATQFGDWSAIWSFTTASSTVGSIRLRKRSV